jgi:uncharacterized protein (DUF433 family)
MTGHNTDDIYGGKKPSIVPLYSLADAAHYLRLPNATVRSWAVGREYPTNLGPTTFCPLIAIAEPDRRLLSFQNLIELHVLSSLRRKHKVELKAVRTAISYLKSRFGSEHPLLDSRMKTDGKDLLIDEYASIINISRNGQLEMKEIMSIYLNRIDQDEFELPVRLFPFSRDNYEKSPKYISIDPKIRFGKPCIFGTRIPTKIIVERHQAGDSISLLAKDYDRKTDEIEEAIRYESRVAA